MDSWDNISIPKGVNWSVPVYKDDKHKRLEKHLLKAFGTEVDVTRKPEIRISKLPICGLIHALELLEDKKTLEALHKTYYTEIGNAVHNYYQRILPLSESKGVVFGDWKCDNCRAVTVRRSTTPEGLICPKCKRNYPTLRYEEIEIEYKSVKGHIDMLFLDQGRYTLMDFKTTSAFNIENPKYLPYPKHLMQAEAYCFMLQNQFGITVSDYFIVYQSRDKNDDGEKLRNARPIGFDVTERMLKRRQDQLDKIVKSRKLIKRLFDDPTPENLKTLDDNRPCRSLHDYENTKTGMAHHFFGTQQCPFLDAEKGSCFGNSKFTKASKKIWELLDP